MWYTGRMSAEPSALAAVAHLLPEEQVGRVTAVEPISMGLSGAGVYAVSSARGELVLRVNAERGDATLWTQQLRVLRRAAARGVAPPLVHVDESPRSGRDRAFRPGRPRLTRPSTRSRRRSRATRAASSVTTT